MLVQLSLIVLEVFVVAVLLATLFELRGRFGLSPLYIAVGSFQYLQVVLALSIYVEIYPGISISPGSSVLFMSALVAILMVYLREDAAETRSLIVGLVISNFGVAALSRLFLLHFSGTNATSAVDLPRELFERDWRLLLVGTGALVIDTFLVIIVYETVGRWQRTFLWPRVVTTLTIVAVVDSLIFITGSFVESPDYPRLLLSSVVGKVLVGFVFSLLFVAYMRFVARDTEAPKVHRDLFQVLSYRERYEQLKQEAVRDPLTSLFNRRFFDEEIGLALSRAERSGNPLCLLVLDIDELKMINDKYGHPVGDEALRIVGSVLARGVRAADVPCRLGGDEFAIISPDAELEDGVKLGQRLQQRLLEGRNSSGGPVTIHPRMSIGVAEYPSDATTAAEVYRIADRRLYLAKGQEHGVVGGEAATDRASG